MGRESPFPWCVVAITRDDRLYTARLPEEHIPLAEERGWVVLIRDSQMPTVKHESIDPAQSNPRRVEDDGA